MTPKIIIGIFGPGEGASTADCECAETLGALIAAEGWVLLTGGRAAGVMDAASRGARQAGGTTIGVLPSAGIEGVSDAVDIPIVTGLREARNYVNVLSSRVVLVCGMGAGTASEVALAIKAKRPVVLVRPSDTTRQFFCRLSDRVKVATSPAEAIDLARRVVNCQLSDL